MRKLILAAGIAMSALFVQSLPAQAAWCSVSEGGARNCGFSSMRACNAYTNGIGIGPCQYEPGAKRYGSRHYKRGRNAYGRGHYRY